ncbi:MAG: type I restriction-modification system subunit M N-terminal domain-containing protein [Verrucomicrobiota bacterium]|nr:type I restriction-modification system subunit M N-terminal domain-containing protein [Verrucomicrobiota bacterium]
MSNSASLVQRLWNYCNILRDDGMSYGDYVEQLTYLLFLKMAEERSKPPFLNLKPLPRGYAWQELIAKNGDAQLEQYQATLRRLSQRNDLFGTIYKNAISKFRDPSKFQKLVAEIDSIEWAKFDSAVKGDA